MEDAVSGLVAMNSSYAHAKFLAFGLPLNSFLPALHQPLRHPCSFRLANALRWHGNLSIHALRAIFDFSSKVGLRIGVFALLGDDLFEARADQFVVHTVAGDASEFLERGYDVSGFERGRCRHTG